MTTDNKPVLDMNGNGNFNRIDEMIACLEKLYDAWYEAGADESKNVHGTLRDMRGDHKGFINCKASDLSTVLCALRTLFLYEQVHWERDVAVSQLEDIGASFGMNMDNFKKVVFCKECENFEIKEDWCRYYGMERTWHDYCSEGKLKKRRR